MGIHPVGKTDESFESRVRQMLLAPHRPNDLGEQGEVTILDVKGMALEERDDLLVQRREVLNGEGLDPAVRSLRADHSTSEEAG